MDIVTLGAALNGSAEYVKSHFKGGANIQIVDNSDGTQTIDASGEVSSEDTVARNAIADIKDGENLDSFADVETALDDKVDKVSGKSLSTNDFTTAEKTKLDDLVEIKSIGTGLSLNSGTGELTATGGGGGGEFTPTTAQLAAMNSGITAEKLQEDETNLSLVKHAANTSLYFQEIQPDNPTVGDYWISTLGNKVYSRTANLFDDTNIINIPNVGERYGVQLPAGYYSILNTTENPVYYATSNWSARQQGCAANSSATINLNLTEGDVGGIFMPLNSASQGGCMVVAGTTIPTEYVPYYDWI